MIYIDAHCHLGSRQFDDDRDEMIARMMDHDVTKAIIICCSEHDLQHGIELRKEHPGLKLACGIHPQDLEEDHDLSRIDRLKEYVISSKADMIGEIGLDYYSHPHTGEDQLVFFERQLQLAEELHLPVDIHCRKAANDTLNILRRHKTKTIIHSYSGSVEMARDFLRSGYYISFGASVLFKGSKRPAEVIRSIPLERLLIETDAPYQSPIRDHRHEPADVIAIYEKIAQIREISIEELAKTVEKNFDEVFVQ